MNTELAEHLKTCPYCFDEYQCWRYFELAKKVGVITEISANEVSKITSQKEHMENCPYCFDEHQCPKYFELASNKDLDEEKIAEGDRLLSEHVEVCPYCYKRYQCSKYIEIKEEYGIEDLFSEINSDDDSDTTYDTYDSDDDIDDIAVMR